jgi:hypothetical protein
VPQTAKPLGRRVDGGPIRGHQQIEPFLRANGGQFEADAR